MGAEQTDVVVIGMGPGGEDAAGRLAQAGLHVTGVEAKLVGGECPYWGCVPSKMMIRAANLLAEARRIPGMAGTSTVAADWAPVAARIRAEATDYWDDKVAVDRFVGKGGHFVRGYGQITGPREVTARTPDGDIRVFAARRGIVIATGTEPAIPLIPGLAGTPYWTNREAIETESVPRSLAVLGGGAVGAELAQVFARFGAQVTVVEAADRLLPAEEPEAGELLEAMFTREGITVLTGGRAERVSHDGRAFRLSLADGTVVAAERLLAATGRRAGLTGLGVAAAGLDPSAKAIPVDGRMRAADGIWAIGDITGKARSPTWPCTRPPSPSATSWDRTGRQLTTGRCRGSPSPTPRSGRWALPRRRPASRAWRCGPGPRRCHHRRGAGSTRRTTTDSSSSSKTPNAVCWWARPRPARWVARCSAPWRSQCTGRSRSPPCGP